jgi:hypothetical protein
MRVHPYIRRVHPYIRRPGFARGVGGLAVSACRGAVGRRAPHRLTGGVACAQAYAARHVSVQAELDGLTALIMRWHRAEVKQWPEMLESRRRRCCEAAGGLFLALSASLASAVGGPRPAAAGDAGDAGAETDRGAGDGEGRGAEADKGAEAEAGAEAHRMVREFVEGSSLGDFDARLEVLRVVLAVVRSRFALFAATHTHPAPDGSGAGSGEEARRAALLCGVLGNALLFYAQFRGVVAAALAEKVGVIEQGLKDLVKICKWENRDYGAMRMNMDRSHRQLHKLLRKYEEALRFSVKLVFQQVVEGSVAKFWSADRPTLSAVPKAAPAAAAPKARKSKGRKARAAEPAAPVDSAAAAGSSDAPMQGSLARVRAVLAALASARSASKAGPKAGRAGKAQQAFDCGHVFSTLLSELRTFPALCGEGRTPGGHDFHAAEIDEVAVEIVDQAAELRETNAIKTIKKRALVSCLRFLAELGLSHHASAVPPHRRGLETLLCGAVDAREVEALPDPSAPHTEERKAAAYFYRCVFLLRKLREACNTASKDVSHGEVHRAAGFCEHVLFLTAVQRETLADFRAQVQRLGAVQASIAALQGEAAGTPAGRDEGGVPPQRWARTLLAGTKRLAAQAVLEAQQVAMLFESVRAMPPGTADALDSSARLLARVRDAADAFDAAVLGCHAQRAEETECCLDGALDPAAAGLVSWSTARAAEQAVAALDGALRAVLEEQASADAAGDASRERSGPDDVALPGGPGARGDTCSAVLAGLVQSLAQRVAGLRATADAARGEATLRDGDVASVGRGLRKLMEEAKEHVLSYSRAVCAYLSREDSQARINGASEDPQAPGNGAPSRVPDGSEAAGPSGTGPTEVGSKAAAEEDEPQSASFNILAQHQSLLDLLSPSRISQLNSALYAVCALISDVSDQASLQDADLQEALACSVKQLQELSSFVNVVHILAEEVQRLGGGFHKACAKLSLVLLGVFNDVILNGFCRPNEKDAEEGDMIDGVEGMGMGEGEGQKNVSDEIEDEEQLVGADQEGAEKKDGETQEREKNEKSVEMKQDFDGNLEDVDDKEEEEEEDKEEDEDKEEVDREMGDVGSDEEQVLDERAGDEDLEDEDDKKKDPKYEKDNPLQGQENKLDAEMRGKEEDEEEDGKEGKPDGQEDKSAAKEPEGEDKGGDDSGDESGQEGGQEGEEVEESHGMDPGADQGGPEEELPEDMQLDQDAGEEGEEEGAEGKSGDEAEEDMQDTAEGADDAVAPPETEEGDAEDEAAGELPHPGQEEPTPVPEGDPEMAVDPSGGDADKDRSDAAAQACDEGRSSRGTVSLDAAGGSSAKPAAQDAAQSADTGAQRGVAGVQATADGEQRGEEHPAQGEEEDAERARAARQRQEANPLRSLGQLVQEQLKREAKDRQDAAEAREKRGDEDRPRGAEAEEYEFVQEEEAADAVATGAATDEQMGQQEQEEASGDAAEEEEAGGEASRTDDKPKEAAARAGDAQERDASWRFGVDKDKYAGQAADDAEAEPDGGDAMEGVELSPEEEEARRVRDAERQREVDGAVRTRRAGPGGDADMADLGADADAADASALPASARDVSSAVGQGSLAEQEAAWSRLVQRVECPARELCEQLRLVLAPTLATKLKGDFQSGKRINLKKIIPYIASQFKRDKIWMRRTCPVKRTYQVLLAVDNSQSMTSMGAADYAREALAMLWKALAQLEVGEVGVLRFGDADGPALLHGMASPLSDSLGAQVSTPQGARVPPQTCPRLT